MQQYYYRYKQAKQVREYGERCNKPITLFYYHYYFIAAGVVP